MNKQLKAIIDEARKVTPTGIPNWEYREVWVGSTRYRIYDRAKDPVTGDPLFPKDS